MKLIKQCKLKLFNTAPRLLDKRLQLANNNIGIKQCTRNTLFACKCIGLLPLAGLRAENGNTLRVQWKSPYTLYYLCSLAGQCLMVFATFSYFSNHVSLGNFTNFLFYMSGAISTILIFRCSLRWRKTVLSVEAIENVLPPIGKKTVASCDLIMVIVLFGALVEHILSILFGLKKAKVCNPDGDIWKTFYSLGTAFVFDYLPYNVWTAILTEIYNLQSTFMWSFNDVLIMIMSLYLTEHFILLNKVLNKCKQKEYMKWDMYRDQFSKIVRIVEMVNTEMNYHILLCFAGNLVWICMQLYNSLNKTQSGDYSSCTNPNLEEVLHGIEHGFYFTYSFLFLLIRSLAMSLLAARVHYVSLQPLTYLYQVPSSVYDVEVKRFVDQVSSSNVALSGMGFFSVTRNLILTMLGTIITYELVLLQFTPGSSNKKDEMQNTISNKT